MKYAVVNQMGGINRITETEPQNIAEGATVVEITDEQAAQVEEGRNATPPVRYVFHEGKLMTLAEKLEIMRPKPAMTAERWIEAQGYLAMRLITLMDIEKKLAEAHKTSEKLTAVRQWLDSIMLAYAADPAPKSDWQPSPFGFEETVQDAMSVLS